jgi:hypothetical protein
MAAVLHSLGAPEAAALRLGALSYIAAAAIGVWLGMLLAARTRDDAFAVAAPAAFAVMGGTFIHATEMVAAIPLALLLVRECRSRAALTALVLLSIPWFVVLEGGMPIAFAVLSAAAIFYEAREAGAASLPQSFMIAVCAGVLLIAAASQVTYASAHAIAIPASTVFPQTTWRALTDATLKNGSPVAWALRTASWAGMLMIATIAATVAYRSEPLPINPG